MTERHAECPQPFDPQTMLLGSELEFTSADPNQINKKTVAKFKQKVIEIASFDDSVEVSLSPLGIRVKSKRGKGEIEFFPHIDPNVLEVPIGPMTLQQAEDSQDLLQTYIWDVAKQIGLEPGTSEVNRWSAHINVSWPGLRDGTDAELFLRFIADFSNHPELCLGGLGGDIRNAPPLAFYALPVRQALGQIIADFNDKVGTAPTVASLARRIITEVYTECFWWSRLRCQALNLEHAMVPKSHLKFPFRVDSATRIEIRSMYMPAKVGGLIAMYRLVSGRIEFLQTCSGPIKYQPRAIKPSVFEPSGVQGNVLPSDVAQVLKSYVMETKVDAFHFFKHLRNRKVLKALSEIGTLDYQTCATNKALHGLLESERV